jgi:hypothetical protein
MVDDAWDLDGLWEAEDGSDDGSVRYHGRRRTVITGSRARWLIGAAAATVAIMATGALIMRPSSIGVADPDVSEVYNTPTASDMSTSDRPIDGGSPPVGAPPTVAGAPPPFAAVTIEAESSAATLSGSAAVTANDRASGGLLVTGIGLHPPGGPPGVFQIGLDAPSAGTYRIVVFFANAEGSNHTSAEVSVSGAGSQPLNFSGNPKCCGTRTVDFTIPAGRHTVTIANGASMAPSIDKVVISRA